MIATLTALVLVVCVITILVCSTVLIILDLRIDLRKARRDRAPRTYAWNRRLGTERRPKP